MKLTDLKVSKAKAIDRPQKLTDGGGLYLYISPTGVKSWRLDYSHNNKRYTHTIGKYPVITLAEARARKLELKKELSAGLSPSVEKHKEKIRRSEEAAQTFELLANEWFQGKKDIRSKAWQEGNGLYLRRDLIPAIGKIPIDEINGKTLLLVLQSIAKDRGVRTADRARQTALQVFEHAILNFKTEKNPAAILRKWAEIPAAVNRPHLEEGDVHQLIDAMDAYPGYLTTKLAAKLLLLTFVRKMEVTDAQWDEFDLQNKKWIIPAERMKMKEAHVVPLSAQAVSLINQLQPYTRGSKYLFPKNSTVLKPMSAASLNKMFDTMGYKGRFSPHGIRATASTWLNEKGFRHDVIERQLAHTERNQVRASYNHADYLLERREMMQAWADFLFPSASK
ncbi:tyrosine-type recombinase/integrase [Herminiimonas fonticola]|uniref:Integrase n=1 Tax=Herminiimonas fonticola TaxID=303380 RepID=A0A4R6G659_9BURK|nr:tyrosine-type recombinase/integrase [Herminiimonas fonticola]RBA23942.1 Phage integrase family [Herminiimonas fonticola]TDN89942.1 integrase [Herminiimonas fonticola]